MTREQIGGVFKSRHVRARHTSRVTRCECWTPQAPLQIRCHTARGRTPSRSSIRLVPDLQSERKVDGGKRGTAPSSEFPAGRQGEN